MSAVLISIQPKWVEKIASGEKTIEVRKSRPKLETPFKCYIYCTIGNGVKGDYLVPSGIQCGKVIGEFVCDEITEYRAEFTDLQYSDARHKKVCQNTIKWVERDDENEETVYRYETSNEEDNPDDCKFLKKSCLTFNEVRKYIGATFFDKPFYGWHISDLKIYDKPKELDEFYVWKKCNSCKVSGYESTGCSYINCKVPARITRPPQSWCYVEELQND